MRQSGAKPNVESFACSLWLLDRGQMPLIRDRITLEDGQEDLQVMLDRS